MNLSGDAERTIVAHARQTAPEECCGLLLGAAAAILEAMPARNIATDRTRHYRIDPIDHFKAIRDGRHRGLDVIGAYHSHPRSSATPSPTDATEGFGDFVFLIVGLVAESPELAAWTWSDGNFVPLPLVRQL